MASTGSRSRSLLLILSLATLLILAAATATTDKSAAADDEADEDLRFLEEDETRRSSTTTSGGAGDHGDQPDEDLEDFDPEAYGQGYDEDDFKMPSVDDKDVIVLTEGNFSDFLKKHKHAMVEFYAPWCGHCQLLAPEYAAAATALKEAGEDVALAKVDATEENELAQKYDVQGYPTVLFFVDSVHKPYTGQRTKDAIVQWIKKKIGPAIKNVTTTEEAEKILTSDGKVVLGFLDSLVSAESQELAAVSKLEDDVNFYQTDKPDVAKLFHIDLKAKRPSLVMLKKEPEKEAYFDDQFTKSAILEFVSANKLPLVNIFTRESATSIFESSIKKQMLLFATSKGSEEVLPSFREAAKLFKGKLLFVYVEMDNEDYGKSVADYFGVTGNGPKVLAYSGNEDTRKFVLDGEVTLDNLKTFGEGFLDDRLKPFYKSDPVPETNDGDVKIVVGDNFDEIVLDESKDVLLEIYAPWCGHCQALEPIYNKLAKHLHGIDSIVIAKMDGTTNEHPRAKADGFPTLLFFPAGNKSFDPVMVDTDRSVVSFYKFLKKHATIPFKLKKPAQATKAESSRDGTIISDAKAPKVDSKDEL